MEQIVLECLIDIWEKWITLVRLISWIDNHNWVVSAVLTLIYAFVTILIFRENNKSTKIMQEQLNLLLAPVIVLGFKSFDKQIRLYVKK